MAMKTTVTVDEVGRLVLPKRVREAIGVCGRMRLTVDVIENSARLRAPEPEHGGRLGRKRGRTIYAGPVPEDWDSGEAV
jgi:bifunctional DNA-binding transcriptional regulator/antitoxin component of YhaV-PrlF toxin-antitoxin module